MNAKNIFVPEFVYILPNGGFLSGLVKNGEIKIGMQTDINGKVLEITNMQVGEEIQETAKEGQRCAFMFVCEGIAEDEIKKGEELTFSEPKE